MTGSAGSNSQQPLSGPVSANTHEHSDGATFDDCGRSVRSARYRRPPLESCPISESRHELLLLGDLLLVASPSNVSSEEVRKPGRHSPYQEDADSRAQSLCGRILNPSMPCRNEVLHKLKSPGERHPKQQP